MPRCGWFRRLGRCWIEALTSDKVVRGDGWRGSRFVMFVYEGRMAGGVRRRGGAGGLALTAFRRGGAKGCVFANLYMRCDQPLDRLIGQRCCIRLVRTPLSSQYCVSSSSAPVAYRALCLFPFHRPYCIILYDIQDGQSTNCPPLHHDGQRDCHYCHWCTFWRAIEDGCGKCRGTSYLPFLVLSSVLPKLTSSLLPSYFNNAPTTVSIPR